MKTRSLAAVAFALFFTAMGVSAQTEAGPIRSSPAYAEVLLRKTELQADLESFLANYTEENPKIIDLRFELAAINRSLDRIYAVKPTETARLTLALGKLIVKKAALETELNRLSRSYSKDHTEVKRARRRVEIFENAVNDVLR
jgi:hypothetical protein